MDAKYAWGTGRRKTSVARVRIRPGKGVITINNQEMEDFGEVAVEGDGQSGPL